MGEVLPSGVRLQAEQAAGVAHLRHYAYRVVLQGVDGRVTLQAPSRGGATPDILTAVPIWPGLSGVKQTLAPGALVVVAFLGGDPRTPAVVGFASEGATPTLTRIPGRVDVAAGTTPVVLASETLLTWIASVSTATAVPAPVGFTATKLFSE